MGRITEFELYRAPENSQVPSAPQPNSQPFTPYTNSNVDRFHPPANNNQQQQQQYQYPTQPQINPQFQYPQEQQQQQPSQPMIPLEMGQTWITNPHWNSVPVQHGRNRRPVESPFLLQILTLGAILTKLTHGVVLLGWGIKEWVDWTNVLEALKGPPKSRSPGTYDLHPAEQALEGFGGMWLGFSMVHIGVLCAVLFGAFKRNLCLVLFWILLLCMDIILQVFVLTTTSLLFHIMATHKIFVGEFSKEFSKYFIFLLVQSVLLLILDVCFFICGYLFCKQLNLEKSRRRHAKGSSSQGGQRVIYSS